MLAALLPSERRPIRPPTPTPPAPPPCSAVVVENALAGPPTAALLRLHSECTSVAHYWAGLERGGAGAMLLGQAGGSIERDSSEPAFTLPQMAALVQTLAGHTFDALMACQPWQEGGQWAA